MKNQYVDNKMFNSIEVPFQKFIELNVRAVQKMSFIKPGDFLSLKNPEEVFEKNVDMIIKNSHMALDYMRDTFSIWENHLSSISSKMELGSKSLLKEVSSSANKSAKKIESSVKSATKKATSNAKSPIKKMASVPGKSISGSQVKGPIKSAEKVKPSLQIKKSPGQSVSKSPFSSEKNSDKDLGLSFNKSPNMPGSN